MKNLFLALVVGFFSLSLVIADAEARRLGGGKSLGRQSPSYSRQATPQQPPAAQRQQQPPATGASRWLGPLAGLAAGGLLAALLFGDGFEGLRFLDFLLLAGLAFAAFMLFRALRARSATPPLGTRHSYASSSPGATANFKTPDSGSGLSGASTAASAVSQRPAWFNEEEFLHAAKTHFIRLQAAWDAGDMQDIREYTTPELFAELTLERQSLDQEKQFTEVVSLNATLLDLVTTDSQVIANVRYSGLIREAKDAEPQAFSEIWHIQRALNDPKANWYVAGIQQEDLPVGNRG